MKEILVYYGKHGNVYWDATDKYKAYLALFKHLDEDWNFYHILKDLEFLKEHSGKQKQVLVDLRGTLPVEDSVLREGHVQAIQKVEDEIKEYKTYIGQAELYVNARKGIAVAANKLLSWRGSYEYERWSIEEVKR